MSKVIVLDERRPPKDEPRKVLIDVTVYDNGDVDLWLSNDVETPAQFNWATAKIAEGVAALLRTKAEVTGTK